MATGTVKWFNATKGFGFIGAAAKRGLLIKGGKYVEAIKSADVVLVDKAGTLTTGKPKVTDVVSLDGAAEATLLRLAATAERHSEHPLAEAVRVYARAAPAPRRT
ncbi:MULTISPECIES: HAD family hydrolase [Bosea]|uniref:HAD family hydrolase n=1 Tax=Bosea eneae TaxID=151454 RepID=A0ABW0J203_9HYPH|nr:MULTISPECIES: HAD family hydrolase [Bosea]MCP4549349.1 HAD family hydrolase [bacterium]MCT4475297.1 HAD family hydrolase [Bosea spartocytisi]